MSEKIVANGVEIHAHPTHDGPNYTARKLAAALPREADTVSRINAVVSSGSWIHVAKGESFVPPEGWEMTKIMNHESGGTSCFVVPKKD